MSGLDGRPRFRAYRVTEAPLANHQNRPMQLR